ncbi:MAG: pentapeptide repeat-containing protein [Leptolyngbyaceae bacterium]|nr:pentapeptide repeat-containing protein [Leptolyngbyaceae bacterium]
MSDNSSSNTTADITTPEALLQAYAKGDRAFNGINLARKKLQGANLKGADLSYADFSGADLSQANLRGADLSYAVLHNTNLTETNLRGAMLIGTDLRTDTLTAAIVTDADYDPEETLLPEAFDPQQAGMKRDR